MSLGSECAMMRRLRCGIANRLRSLANFLGAPMTRPPFNPGELEQLLQHLAYERLMFEHSLARWNATCDRATLEAFLLHARNLRDFLFDTVEEHGRDAEKVVIATDYVPDWSSDKGNHAYQVLWNTKQAMNAQLAHLSRRRADPEVQRKLDVEADNIAAAVDKAWGLFVEALGETPWSAEWDQALLEKRRELRFS